MSLNFADKCFCIKCCDLNKDCDDCNVLVPSNSPLNRLYDSIQALSVFQVSDFGLSRIHIGERTIATQTYGTVTHMPPELLSEGRLSKAADVCKLSRPQQATFRCTVSCKSTSDVEKVCQTQSSML